MIFLTETDFKKQIRQSVLSQVIEEDVSHLYNAELEVIEEIEGYLRSRFDVAQIWNKIGANRNALIVMYAVDMILYHLHSRISPGQIPEIRVIRFDSAISYFKAVQKGTISPNLPLIDISSQAGNNENTGKFAIGSDKRRRN